MRKSRTLLIDRILCGINIALAKGEPGPAARQCRPGELFEREFRNGFDPARGYHFGDLGVVLVSVVLSKPSIRRIHPKVFIKRAVALTAIKSCGTAWFAALRRRKRDGRSF